jgi:UDP-MurNAc hydroxylase
MQIEYVTHASLSLRAQGITLLTDPFYFFDEIAGSFLRHFPPRHIEADTFGRLDYVYSSHIHLDHSHPETLEVLKDKIGTVLLPSRRPSLERRYRDLGFDDIILLENGKPQALRGGIEVTSYWSDPVDSALVVRMDGITVLHQNDCVLDTDTINEIAKRYAIDYAFIWYTSSQSLCPLLLPRTEAELDRLAQAREDTNFLRQVECVDILKPKVVAPYSMTMTYVNADQIWLNGIGRLTPVTFKERLAALRPEQRCIVVQPGDIVDTESDTVRPYRDSNLWGTDLRSYLDNIAEYARNEPSIDQAFICGDLEAVDAQVHAHFRKRFETQFAQHLQGQVIALTLRGDAGERSYFIDTQGKKLITDLAEANRRGQPLLKVTMPAVAFLWLISKKWDPFHILFCRRIEFDFSHPLSMTPDDETLLYIYSLVSIVDYNLQLEPSEVTRLLAASRIQNVSARAMAAGGG